jgi:hypothetical protein
MVRYVVIYSFVVFKFVTATQFIQFFISPTMSTIYCVRYCNSYVALLYNKIASCESGKPLAEHITHLH